MTWAGLTPPYKTIVADPPWAHKGSVNALGVRGKTKRGGIIEAQPATQYSTMATPDICAMPVPELADRNAHLYLWVTNSHLADGLAVMAAWGFTYKTALTWIKGSIGLGAYFRTSTEHVLFGVRGSLPTATTDQLNYFHAARQAHSVKPDSFMDIVERSSPEPRVELFCRRPRFGWDSWGRGYESTVNA